MTNLEINEFMKKNEIKRINKHHRIKQLEKENSNLRELNRTLTNKLLTLNSELRFSQRQNKLFANRLKYFEISYKPNYYKIDSIMLKQEKRDIKSGKTKI